MRLAKSAKRMPATSAARPITPTMLSASMPVIDE